jgi:hypothetical protein
VETTIGGGYAMNDPLIIVAIAVAVLGALLLTGGGAAYYLLGRKRGGAFPQPEEQAPSTLARLPIFGLAAAALLVLIGCVVGAWFVINGRQSLSQPTETPSICSTDVLRRFEQTQLCELVTKSVEAGPALVENLHWQISARGDGCVAQLHGTMNDQPMPVVYSFYIEMPDGIIYADSDEAANWMQYIEPETLEPPEQSP